MILLWCWLIVKHSRVSSNVPYQEQVPNFYWIQELRLIVSLTNSASLWRSESLPGQMIFLLLEYLARQKRSSAQPKSILAFSHINPVYVYMVIPIVSDHDAILGETWHASAQANAQYDTDGMKFVRIYKGRTVRKLIQTAREPMEGVSSKEPLISHVQYNKARKKLGFFIAHVKFAPEHQGEMSPSEKHNLPSLSSDHNSKIDPKPLTSS